MKIPPPTIARRLWPALLLTLGCQITVDEDNADAASHQGDAAPQAADGAPEPEGPDAHAEPPMEEGGFEVHEWGLQRFLSGGADLSTSGYGLFVSEDTADKPLIYFHPNPGFDASTEISVRVTAEGGRMREMWPEGGTLSEDRASYTWPSFTLQPDAPCGADEAPRLERWDEVGPSSGYCARLGWGVCEAAELHEYFEEAPHCLDVDGLQAPVLLYNAYINPELAAPVTLEETTLRNASDHPVGPIWVAAATEADPRTLYRIDALAPGEAVDVLDQPVRFTSAQHGDFLADLRAALEARGLTADEAMDFVDAWRPNVLSEASADGDSMRPWEMPYEPWAALGFYSQAATDAMYPLEITPAPLSVSRALGFTIQ